MVSTTVFREVIVIDFWEGHFGYGKLTINGFFNSFLKQSLLVINGKDIDINGCFRNTTVALESQILMCVFVSFHLTLSKTTMRRLRVS